MDPTNKIYTLILISKLIKNPLNVIPAIEKAIEDGAILDDDLCDPSSSNDYHVPIYEAIYNRCDIEIIKTLQKHWWDINKQIECVYIYQSDINDPCSDIFQTLHGEGHLFFNILYTKYKVSLCIDERKYIESILEHFKPNIIYDDELRHIYLLEYKKKKSRLITDAD